MEKYKRTRVILLLVTLAYFLTLRPSFGVEICGTATYQIVNSNECDAASPPSCSAPIKKIKINCWIEDGKCITRYAWTACYSYYNPVIHDYYCRQASNVLKNYDCDVAGGGGGPGPSYEMITCDPGKYLSCGSDAEATQQNKSFCGYKKTCNKYYFPSSYNFPECKTTPEGNPLYTCRTNCSCCDIGTERTCTLGASYTNTVSLYVGGGDDPVDGVYNQMMKDTCYRDGVKRRNDIVVSITLKRSYTKKDNTEWQDWEQSCRVQNCSCKAPPTPTLTPQNKQRPADRGVVAFVRQRDLSK
ncbi:MAG TPA: hypothetical protein PKC99_15760, partial [Anaerolineales bacterium]|nr:hypothetical protein [Anaerolineales bacterium]